jgi:hypothetical protein
MLTYPVNVALSSTFNLAVQVAVVLAGQEKTTLPLEYVKGIGDVDSHRLGWKFTDAFCGVKDSVLLKAVGLLALLTNDTDGLLVNVVTDIALATSNMPPPNANKSSADPV